MSLEERRDESRRRFCRGLLGAGFAALGLAGVRSAPAQDEGRVDEQEPAARSLGYRHDATQVDTESFPKRAGVQGARQFCDNCALFGGEPGDRSAPCSIFQGRLVSGKGWCNAWVSRS